MKEVNWMKPFTVQDYLDALEGAGPKLKENILGRANEDPNIDWDNFKKLVDFVYPDPY